MLIPQVLIIRNGTQFKPSTSVYAATEKTLSDATAHSRERTLNTHWDTSANICARDGRHPPHLQRAAPVSPARIPQMALALPVVFLFIFLHTDFHFLFTCTSLPLPFHFTFSSLSSSCSYKCWEWNDSLVHTLTLRTLSCSC